MAAGSPIGITPLSLLWSYLLLLPPLFISWKWGLSINRKILTAAVRMTVQLYLMGYYLGWIFRLNSPWLNLAWISVMLIVANIASLRQRELSFRTLFWPTTIGNILVFFPTVGFFMLLVVQNTSPFAAQFLIPVAGMLLGNTMRGNTIALEHFFGELRRNPGEYTTRLLMGATPAEASQPYLYSAMRLTTLPHLAVMATVGIVAMPGMMTGQMLTGAVPMKAVMYQLALMIGVFACRFMAAFASLLCARQVAFDEFGILRPEVFYNAGGGKNGPKKQLSSGMNASSGKK